MVWHKKISSKFQRQIQYSYVIKEKLKHLKWKKILLIPIISFILLFTLFNSVIRISYRYKPSGYAQWKSVNGNSYLEVKADNPYDQGFLIGEHIADKIINLKRILKLFSLKTSYSYTDLENFAQQYIPFIPQSHMDEMKGMADGATHRLGFVITLNDILIQNTWIDTFYGRLQPSEPALVGCTAIAGYYNQSLFQLENFAIIGQNFDFTKIFRFTASFIYQKNSHVNSIFGLHLGGSLNLPIGKNGANLTILSTLVQSNKVFGINIPITCRSRYAFTNAYNGKEFQYFYFDRWNQNFTVGHTIIWGNLTTFHGAQINHDSAKVINNSGLVFTNRYTIDGWEKDLVDINYSKTRQERAEQLMVEYNFEKNASGENLFKILQDKPIIYRKTKSFMETQTMCFLTSSHFGFGCPSLETASLIPI